MINFLYNYFNVVIICKKINQKEIFKLHNNCFISNCMGSKEEKKRKCSNRDQCPNNYSKVNEEDKTGRNLRFLLKVIQWQK